MTAGSDFATHPRRRSPVSLIAAAVAVFGWVMLARDFSPAVRVFAGPALLATVLGILAGLVGWWILRRMAPLVRADVGVALRCLVWGATAAIGCALLANQGLKNIWSRTTSLDFAAAWGDALTAPINEELLKLAGLVLLALMLTSFPRGPMDGFVYGAFVGLGFEVVENWTYALNSVLAAGGTSAGIDVIQSFVGRVVFTSLGSHWAMSAVAGAGLGYLVTRRGSARRTTMGLGLIVLAMLMHFLFDSPLLGFPAGVIIKTVVNFAIAMTVYLLLRHHVRTAALAYIAQLPDVPAALIKRRQRRRALRQITEPAARAAAAARQRQVLAEVADHAYRAA